MITQRKTALNTWPQQPTHVHITVSNSQHSPSVWYDRNGRVSTEWCRGQLQWLSLYWSSCLTCSTVTWSFLLYATNCKSEAKKLLLVPPDWSSTDGSYTAAALSVKDRERSQVRWQADRVNQALQWQLKEREWVRARRQAEAVDQKVQLRCLKVGERLNLHPHHLAHVHPLPLCAQLILSYGAVIK